MSQGVLDYRVRLLVFLKDPRLAQILGEYLEKMYCKENLMFWRDVEEYKNITSPDKLREYANLILKNYLESGAPHSVSVDYIVSENIKKELNEKIIPDLNLFCEAQECILQLLLTDIFPKFLKSELYLQSVLSKSAPSSPPLSLHSNNSIRQKRHSSPLTSYSQSGFVKVVDYCCDSLFNLTALATIDAQLTPSRRKMARSALLLKSSSSELMLDQQNFETTNSGNEETHVQNYSNL